MIKELFSIYDSLLKKQEQINSIIEVFLADENGEFLGSELKNVELLIVKSLGGTEEHFEYISDCDLFYDYGYRENTSQQELVENIKTIIKEDLKGNINISFQRG